MPESRGKDGCGGRSDGFGGRGGSSHVAATAAGSSTITVSGGVLQAGAQARGSGTLLVSGGILFNAGGSNTSAVTLSGGAFTDAIDGFQFFDATTGSFTFGGGLSAPDLGHNNLGEAYQITGMLSDGSSVTGDTVEVYTGALPFTLVNSVPEPAPRGILMLSGIVWVRRGRVGARRH